MPHSSRPPGPSQGRPRPSSAQGGYTSSRHSSSGGRGRPRDASLAGAPAGVRRQSGRQSRRPNLWPRRIITGLGLLAILGLLVWALVSTFTWAFSGGEDAPQSAAQSGEGDPNTPRMTADGIVTSADSVQIPECTAEMLAITSTADSIHVGHPLTTALNVTTQPNIACSTAAGMFGLVVTSGDQLYYDSRRCEGYDPAANPLLLSPTASWSGELFWDARRYNGCVAVDNDGDGAADTAEPGTYKVRIVYGEQSTASEHVIEVIP